MRSPNDNAWSSLGRIGRAFFLSPKRWHAAGLLVAIAGLLLTLNALNLANSYVGRNFITALAQRDRNQFLRFAAFYLGVFAASSLTAVSAQYVQDRLAISWRGWMTQHLTDRYLSGDTHDEISARTDIDNPDQRIAEDVRAFTSTLLSFAIMLTNSVVTLLVFAGVLWSITPLLLLAAVLYAALGSAFTILIGYRLVGLNNQQLSREADMRHGLIHVRQNGQPLDEQAVQDEASGVRARLQRVIHNSMAIIRVTRNVGFFTSGYNYMVPILPVLIVAPLYLRGSIELGVVTQSAMAFAQLLGALSLIVAQFGSISAFAAVARRLGSLWEAMETTGEFEARA